MQSHGPQAVGGGGGSEVATGRESCGSCEREGNLREHLFHYSPT